MTLQTINTQFSTLEVKITHNPHTPTLLFLHGLGANLNQFTAQHQFFSDYFQVISLNVVGHGNSHSTRPFSFAHCAQDVIDLLDALSIDQFHFVGNSMGGCIGYELLQSFDARLLSITTFGTTIKLDTSKTKEQILTWIYKILPIRWLAQIVSISGQTPTSRQLIKTLMSQMKRETVLTIVPILARYNYLLTVHHSQTPYLLIKGGKDSDINQALADSLIVLKQREHFTLSELEHVGHFANLDDPDPFNAVLLDFLYKI